MTNALLLVLLLALPGQVAGPLAGQDRVVATFEGGRVLAADLERERAFLPRDEQHYREVAGFEEAKNEDDWIRRIASRRLAAREDAEEIAKDEALRELARSQARGFALARLHQDCYGLAAALPGDAELRARVGEVPRLPLRVKVSHLFLKVAPGEDPAPVRQRLAGLRETLPTIEAFRAKAREISESQSRVRGGALGWIRPGTLTKAAEDLLFAMPVGAISEPVELRGGWHLFFLEGRREPEDQLPWRLERERIRAVTEARQRCRAERLAAAQVKARVEGDELVVGDYRLPLANIPARPEESPAEALARFRDDEILFQEAQRDPDGHGRGGLSAEERLRLVDLEENVYLAHYVETRAEKRLLQPKNEELQALYGDGSGYVRPRHLSGTFLRAAIPPAHDPFSFLEELEALSLSLASGETTFAAAKARLGAELVVFPLQSQLEVAGLLGPVVFDQVHRLPLGTVSGPIQDGEVFLIVRLDQEEGQRPLSFEAALPDLLQVWRRRELARHKGQLLRELLEKGKFRR